MRVSACLVTRGDVEMHPILDSLPPEWEKVVWMNGVGVYVVPANSDEEYEFVPSSNPPPDLSVYGRYAAIKYATGDLIYVQDDDVIVSDPQAIVDAWIDFRDAGWITGADYHVVCNMPLEFRHDFYREHALVGFGAVFHRDAPDRAFMQFADHRLVDFSTSAFKRCCDVVFTALTPRVLVDVPKTNLPYAEADDRMYRQPEHVGERQRMLELALKTRQEEP